MAESYRAIEQYRFAESFRAATRIVTLPLPEPGPGEVLVRNSWCGINGIFDTQLARNAVGTIRMEPPFLTGVEAVGTVEAVGSGVTDLALGQAVAATRFRGGYREANCGPAADFVPLPEASAEALALASSGVAAWLALTLTGAMQRGETVAVSAAAGGLGHLAVQIAKLHQCHVIAICGGAKKAAFVKALGADRVIDYRTESVAEVLTSEYHDRIDLALDTVGGEVFDAMVDNLANHGRLVISGWASDMVDDQPSPVTAPRIGHKLYYKGASVRAFMNALHTAHWPAARAALFELYAKGLLKPHAEALGNGLDAVPDAVEALLAGQTMGKAVVRL
ncbi:MAG: zinc-binding dehydrogenase [Novosphingobium sp.]